MGRYTVAEVARVCHEANRLLQLIEADPAIPPALPWLQCPDWMRESTVEGVLGAWEGNTPEESHEGWMANRIADGWVFGPVKDEEAKTHPCLVPYDELPEAYQIKDALFVAIARALQ